MYHLEFNQVIQWKFLFSLIMYLVTWTKKSTEKSIHFYHISSNFLQCYNLYSWQMSISAVLFTESYWKNWYCKFFFSSGGHPCTRWMFDKNANSLQAGRSLSSSPHRLYANKPTTDTTTENSDEVQIQ